MSFYLRAHLWVLILLAFCARAAYAGPVNPDISVIGDVRATYNETEDRVILDLEETEFAFVGPVNPYATAEVFVGAHGTDQFEIEEAKLILDRYFPAGFGLTIGRYLQDFGQLNVVHSHAYPYVELPLMHTGFFSMDGIIDNGIRLDWLAPFDAVNVRATVGAVRGNLFLSAEEHTPAKQTTVSESETGATSAQEDSGPEVGASGRLEAFTEFGDRAYFLLGTSVLHGTFDPAENAMATWSDIDFKAKFDLGPSRNLVLNAEAIFGSLDATDETKASDPSGWFASADFRLTRRWNFGGFAESASEKFDDSVRTNRFGGFVGIALLEESTLFRLVGHVTDPEEGGSESGVLLQTIFAVGPHRPHRF